MQQTSPMEVGVAVIDLELMGEFYANVLGCKEIRRADIPAALRGEEQP